VYKSLLQLQKIKKAAGNIQLRCDAAMPLNGKFAVAKEANLQYCYYEF